MRMDVWAKLVAWLLVEERVAFKACDDDCICPHPCLQLPYHAWLGPWFVYLIPSHLTLQQYISFPFLFPLVPLCQLNSYPLLVVQLQFRLRPCPIVGDGHRL